MLKRLITLGMALVMLFSLAGLAACGDIETGFEILSGSSEPMPDYPYFQVYSACRFAKKKCDLNNVSMQFYYGHTLHNLDPRKNAESETKIVLTASSTHAIVKEVDDFLSDEYSVEATWVDIVDHTMKLEFNHSETIPIPANAFENGLTHVNGKYRIGSFLISVTCEITDARLEEIIINGKLEGGTSRGYGGSGVDIYYCVNIDKGTVAIGKDDSVYENGLYKISNDEGSGYREIRGASGCNR